MYAVNLTYIQLLTYGVHLGHTLTNTNLYAAWMVYTRKHELVILNIFKTYFMLKIGFKSIDYAVRLRCPVWFVTLDKSAYAFSKFAAYSCGEFYWAGTWMNGLIANYPQFFKIYKSSLRCLSEWSYNVKRNWISRRFYDWRLTRTTWPRAVFISNVSKSWTPVLECNTILIPCVGITDSDINTGLVMFPVPGNDESLECLCYYSDIVANHILIRKFEQIGGFIGKRSLKRVVNFRNWLLNKYLVLGETDIYGRKSLRPKIHIESLKAVYRTSLLSGIYLTFAQSWDKGLIDNKLSYFSFGTKSFSEANAFGHILSSRLQLNYVWIYYLSHVQKAMDFWKWSPFNVRKGSTLAFTWTKSFRVTTNYRWNDKRQFLRYCLHPRYFKKSYRSSEKYIFDIIGLKGVLLPQMAKRYLKYNYLLKFNKYSSRSWRISNHFSSNYYLKYLVEQLLCSNKSIKDLSIKEFTTFGRNANNPNPLSYTPSNLFKMFRFSKFLGKNKVKKNLGKIIQKMDLANYLISLYLGKKINCLSILHLEKFWTSLVPKFLYYIQRTLSGLQKQNVSKETTQFKNLVDRLNYAMVKLDIYIMRNNILSKKRYLKLYDITYGLKKKALKRLAKKHKRLLRGKYYLS